MVDCLTQNVPGYRPDRRGPRPGVAPGGPLLLRAPGQRGQAPELPARAELAAGSLSVLPPSLNTQTFISVFKVGFFFINLCPAIVRVKCN